MAYLISVFSVYTKLEMVSKEALLELLPWSDSLPTDCYSKIKK